MITYRSMTASALESDRSGFTVAYQEAFAGPPYFEHYSDEEVIEDVWRPHLRSGIVILAYDGARVVGFGCALPLAESPADVREFLASLGDDIFPVDVERTWYMSELGVLEGYRRQGIGYGLVKHRLLTISHRRDTHYVFRTAAEGSNSYHLYRKVGAIELPVRQDVSTIDQVVVNGSQSGQRVYLYGACEPTIHEILSAQG